MHGLQSLDKWKKNNLLSKADGNYRRLIAPYRTLYWDLPENLFKINPSRDTLYLTTPKFILADLIELRGCMQRDN